MIGLKTLRSDLHAKWLRQYLACALVDEAQRFPLTLSLKPPSNAQILADWQSVKTWASVYAELNEQPFTIEWKQRNTPLGKQDLPIAITFASVDALAQFLKTTTELKDYRQVVGAVCALFPSLKAWCLRFPAKVLSMQAEQDQLLRVLTWFVQHPAPHCYLREIALPDVDSKFIETHHALLNEWLSILCVPVDGQAKSFELRWGIKRKPERLRLRFLGEQSIGYLQDIEAPFAQWSDLDWQGLGIERVFITENEINFLTFPHIDKSIILFGKGYGFDAWRSLPWLNALPIFYWGDVDTHGFAILNQLRQAFAQVRSMLMDEQTLLAHRVFWGRESTPLTKTALDYLTLDEQAVYQGLLGHRWQVNLRLEQERIALQTVAATLKQLMKTSG